MMTVSRLRRLCPDLSADTDHDVAFARHLLRVTLKLTLIFVTFDNYLFGHGASFLWHMGKK